MLGLACLLRVLDQLIGLGDPHRAAPALEPVVEQDAGDLAALAGAIEERATAEAILGVVGRGRDDIERVIDRPRARKIARMGLAGVDNALEPSAITAGNSGRNASR